jgi:hypothetical protein
LSSVLKQPPRPSVKENKSRCRCRTKPPLSLQRLVTEMP